MEKGIAGNFCVISNLGIYEDLSMRLMSDIQ